MKPFRLKPPEPREADVLSAVLTALKLHPKVAWAQRMQTGAGKLLRKGGASQWLRFGWVGAPDVVAQLRDGRFMAVECKRPSGSTTPEQDAFLACVAANGGVAVVARSVDDLLEALK